MSEIVTDLLKKMRNYINIPKILRWSGDPAARVLD
jgi:hypothetical protein